MIAVTGACTALAYRHASLVIAMIGLIGGFATPFLLSTGEDRPIALFAYILLLDACLLFVARRRGWPRARAGEPARHALLPGAPGSAGACSRTRSLLALVRARRLRRLLRLRAARQPVEGRRSVLVTQGGAVLFPFAFALYLAARRGSRPPLLPGRDSADAALGLRLLARRAQQRSLARARRRVGRAGGLRRCGCCGRDFDGPRWPGRRWRSACCWPASSTSSSSSSRANAGPPTARRPRRCSARSACTRSRVLTAIANPLRGLWPWLAGWLGLTRALAAPRRLPGSRAAAGGRGRRARTRLVDLPLVARRASSSCRASRSTRRRCSAVAIAAPGRRAAARASRSCVATPSTPRRSSRRCCSSPSRRPSRCRRCPRSQSARCSASSCCSRRRARPTGAGCSRPSLLTAFVHLAWTVDEPLLSQDAPASALRALGIQLARGRALHGLALRRLRAPARRALRLVRLGARGTRLVPLAARALRDVARQRRRSASCPSRSARCSLAAAAQARRHARGDGSAPHQQPRLVPGRVARLPDRRHPAPARQGVDHDRLGARGPRRHAAVAAPRPRRPQVLRAGTARWA